VVNTQILTPRGRGRPALAFNNGETLSEYIRLKTGKIMIERAENFIILRRKKLISKVPAYSVKKGLVEVRKQVLVGEKGRRKCPRKGCGKGRGRRKGRTIHLDERQCNTKSFYTNSCLEAAARYQ